MVTLPIRGGEMAEEDDHPSPLSTGLTTPEAYTIYTSRLFSPLTSSFHSNLALTVSSVSGLITSSSTHSLKPQDPVESPNIDLRAFTVLPGFVDAHTHIFLHPYAEASSLNQMRDESLVERILRASNHCRAALKAGYTTYRDLGTEGLGDADVGVRDAINRGIIPGPRLFVATEALASSASYAIRYESRQSGTSVPRISDPCDGVEGVMAGVRRRVGAGADLIKFYADYRRRTLRYPPPTFPGAPAILNPPGPTVPYEMPSNPNSVLWSQPEMDAIVVEARRACAPVAAHAVEAKAVIMACKAGVTTIEHGYIPNSDALEAMRAAGVIWIPTLSVIYEIKSQLPPGAFEEILDYVQQGYANGVKLACGGDTGAFAHGENAREMELMIQAGVPVLEVLRAGTMGGWEACGGDLCGKRFGVLEPGWSADLVGLKGDPRDDFGAVRRVEWVIKDGRVMVRDGNLVV